MLIFIIVSPYSEIMSDCELKVNTSRQTLTSVLSLTPDCMCGDGANPWTVLIPELSTMHVCLRLGAVVTAYTLDPARHWTCMCLTYSAEVYAPVLTTIAHAWGHRTCMGPASLIPTLLCRQWMHVVQAQRSESSARPRVGMLS